MIYFILLIAILTAAFFISFYLILTKEDDGIRCYEVNQEAELHCGCCGKLTPEVLVGTFKDTDRDNGVSYYYNEYKCVHCGNINSIFDKEERL